MRALGSPGTHSQRSISIRAAVAVSALLLLASLTGCASRTSRPHTKTEFAFDTVCTISLYDRAPRGTLDGAFALLKRIGGETTIDAKNDELIKVNNAAGRRPVEVSAGLFHLIQVGIHFSRLSEGAFDITVGPLTKLWGIGTGGDVVPPEAKIKHAVGLINYRDVVLNEAARTVYLRRQGMVIDLGGIAKGYAGDRVKEFLKKAGVRHAIIDLGGNVVTIGSKPDGSPWRIGIQDPAQTRGSYIGILKVSGEAVVSSGQYERFFVVDGRRYGHILSTRSGFPVDNGIASTTIITPSSTDGDALSTAVFALGIEKGLALVNSLPGVEAVILTSNRQVYLSNGIADSFRLTDPAYTLAPQITVPQG